MITLPAKWRHYAAVHVNKENNCGLGEGAIILKIAKFLLLNENDHGNVAQDSLRFYSEKFVWLFSFRKAEENLRETVQARCKSPWQKDPWPKLQDSEVKNCFLLGRWSYENQDLLGCWTDACGVD